MPRSGRDIESACSSYQFLRGGKPASNRKSDPDGIRTRVAAVKGLCPRPARRRGQQLVSFRSGRYSLSKAARAKYRPERAQRQVKSCEHNETDGL